MSIHSLYYFLQEYCHFQDYFVQEGHLVNTVTQQDLLACSQIFQHGRSVAATEAQNLNLLAKKYCLIGQHYSKFSADNEYHSESFVG
jgi:hypothetical protein